MKRLIWKEVTELSGTMATVSLMFIACSLASGSFTSVALSWCVPMAFLSIGLIAGCGTLAGERGKGTLSFLSSLPLDRARIWLVKFAVALVVSAAATAASLAIILLAANMFPTRGLSDGWNPDVLLMDTRSGQWWLDMTALLLFGLTAAMAVSAIVDRVLTAIILAGAAALATVAGCVGMSLRSYFMGASSDIFYGTLAGIAVLFGLVSYGVFQYDDGTDHRWRNFAWGIGLVFVVTAMIELGSLITSDISARRFPDTKDQYVVSVGLSNDPITPKSEQRTSWGYSSQSESTGRGYRMLIQIDDAQAPKPWRCDYSGRDITAHMVMRPEIIDVTPELEIAYTPSGTPMQEFETIPLYDANGNVFQDALVKVEKRP